MLMWAGPPSRMAAFNVAAFFRNEPDSLKDGLPVRELRKTPRPRTVRSPDRPPPKPKAAAAAAVRAIIPQMNACPIAPYARFHRRP